MEISAKRLIEIAEAEEGYLEKASNASLDSDTANAGSANYTKYARDLDAIPNFYNGKKNGYAWCDVFVDWCFVKAFGAENALKLTCQPEKSAGAGCKYSAQYYKNKGQFHKTPKVGDQIFFHSGGDPNHTGIVRAVDSSKVYTVEGNTSSASGVVANGGSVRMKSYSLNYSRIYGYGRPAYDAIDTKVDEPAETTAPVKQETAKKESVYNVAIPMVQKGSEGKTVKALQLLLIGYGYSCGSYGADGDFGSATKKAVIAYQKANGLEDDGVVGPLTWAKLLGV